MLFNLDQEALHNLLVNKFYSIQTAFGVIRFSKRELQVFIALLKGCTAGETAHHLQLKQTTIESYLVNIKNKTGATSKSELIHFAISINLLEQIAV
jgi:DNA-binding NarL/FixJ family response regulator